MDDIVIYDDDDAYFSLDAVGHTSRLWSKEGNEVIIPYLIPDGSSEHHLHLRHQFHGNSFPRLHDGVH